MEFEWDPARHERNLRERHIGLDAAALIFRGAVISWQDMRRDYGEVRMIGIGEANGEVLRVVFTVRGNVVRIITAWRAGRKDRQRWQTGC